MRVVGFFFLFFFFACSAPTRASRLMDPECRWQPEPVPTERDLRSVGTYQGRTVAVTDGAAFEVFERSEGTWIFRPEIVPGYVCIAAPCRPPTSWVSPLGQLFSVSGGGIHARGMATDPNKSLPTSATMRAVWGTSGHDVYAAGDAGAIVHFDGGVWTLEESGTRENLIVIRGDEKGRVFAIGEGGTVVYREGARWRAEATCTQETLYDLMFLPSGEALAVGARGTVLRRSF